MTNYFLILITLLLIMTGSASLRLASMITHDMRHTILLKKTCNYVFKTTRTANTKFRNTFFKTNECRLLKLRLALKM